MNARPVPGQSDREKTWKLVSTLTALLGTVLAKRLMRMGYQAVRKDAIRNKEAPETPFDSTSPRFSWRDALLWAAAAGVGLGISKVLSTRLAAFGWEIATGTAPPGDTENPS